MSDAPTFGARLMGVLLAAGIALAGVFAVLTAYGGEFRNGNDGGGHALSNAAVGFSGIARLAQASGLGGLIGKDEAVVPAGGLLVLTPDIRTDPARVMALVEARVATDGATPVLIVLPKWQTGPVELHPGWVEQAGTLPGGVAALPVSTLTGDIATAAPTGAACCVRPADSAAPAWRRPAQLRVLVPPPPPPATRGAGDDFTAAMAALRTPPQKLVPSLLAPGGGMVMGWSRAKDTYVLADPDLLDNHGIADAATARAALALLHDLGNGGPVTFDVTLNGYGRTRNLARLAFEPPFLALTLCLIAAAALAGLQGAFRFGPARASPRAIAFGKRALVDNAAALIRNARREPAMAGRYARLMLEHAGAARGAPAGLDAERLAAWLDRRASGPGRYAELAAKADAATTRDEGLAAARALHAWKEDVTHDGR